MNVPHVCDSCALAQPMSLIDLMPVDERIRQLIREDITSDDSVTKAEQTQNLFIHLSLCIFGGPDEVSMETVHAVHRCLESVWNLGNRGMNCSQHHMKKMYEAAGRGTLCLRKYMMEETITFFRDIWENDARKNEEQFQAIVNSRWPIHWGALTM